MTTTHGDLDRPATIAPATDIALSTAGRDMLARWDRVRRERQCEAMTADVAELREDERGEDPDAWKDTD